MGVRKSDDGTFDGAKPKRKGNDKIETILTEADGELSATASASCTSAARRPPEKQDSITKITHHRSGETDTR